MTPLVYRLMENLYPDSIQSERHSPEYLDIESVLSPVLFKRNRPRNYVGVSEPDVKYGDAQS